MTRFFEFFEPVIEIHQNLRGCAGYCVCECGVDDFFNFLSIVRSFEFWRFLADNHERFGPRSLR